MKRTRKKWIFNKAMPSYGQLYERLFLGIPLLLNDGWDGVGEMELLQILRTRETAEG